MFNHSLAETLSKNHEVHRVSFSLQYPKGLFPGKTQFFEFQGEQAKTIINSINPFSWKKSVKYINRLKPETVIFQYWMPFFAPAFASIAKGVKKGCGAKLIVNCNNITPHESRPLDSAMTARFFSLCDGFIVMSNTVEEDLLKIEPNTKYRKTPHPIYDIFGEPIEKQKAKELIGVSEEKIILNFGLIRDYKGLDILITSAKSFKEKIDNFKILVVGECYGDENKYIQLAEENDVFDVIDFRFNFVQNEKVNQYFCASDLVVLPYKSATQSGVVPIAYHFNKPVVVSNVGGLPEIVEDGKSGFICEPNSDSISKGVLKYFESDREEFPPFIEEYKKQFSWDNFAEVVLELAES
ncbi:MAG: glycosyltransferase [Candidatus Marinimicrobia bacterium]|nr:glycosyltransferase [Candidatus Neomarinimicrobiota bacterium]MBL7030373.1 glycosyltransferase [Candidatus Neomarinimicrobiota bacterium]